MSWVGRRFSTSDSDESVLRRRGFALGTLALSLLAAAVVGWLATDLFAYHSVNDDEAVYLTQAAMLLEGRLFLRPGALAEVVRPWFFVVDDGGETLRMYGKYSPAVPAIFALSRALTGGYVAALVAVAAGIVALVAVLGRMAFDERVGLLAGAFVLASPLFLFTSSVYLAYAPTTLLNLCFAVAYVRASRIGSRRWALVSGVAVGAAFFARQFTAVLFAAPFIVHSLAVLSRALGTDRLRETLVRTAAVSVPGLAFVALTLGYNAAVTGDPLLFPYEAFAPRDGLGFGEREILGYVVDYTPELAVAVAVEALSMLFTDWVAVGSAGALLAAVGVGVAALRWRRAGAPVAPKSTALSVHGVRALLLGVAVSVVVGNLYFWGTHNGLANGLVDLLGPYYHFDLLVPFGVFAAAGVVAVADAAADAVEKRRNRRTARVALACLLLVSAPVVAAAEASVVADPYEENRLRTDNFETTYEPFERAEFDRALVFVPSPYGDWQNHPFQYLRNDPGFDGDVVYALDDGPDRDFQTLAAVENRTLYRFTYRGTWTGAVEPVDPELQRLELLRGERIDGETTVGVPSGATRVSVRVETKRGYARYSVGGFAEGDAVAVEWTVTPDGVRVANLDRTGGDADGPPVPLPSGASELDLVVRFAGTAGESVTYRQELTVDRDGDEVRALWPPETRVCRLRTECGREGTWVGPDGDYLDGVSVATNATASG
uniref:ArnT family glycosyltransferase n=1 Tax=Haloprofundus halophilus TaxID=2283527 RepID=UPI000E440A27|nr:glycosyltransferase family 39 protein [Haloprofundus halophilus]